MGKIPEWWARGRHDNVHEKLFRRIGKRTLRAEASVLCPSSERQWRSPLRAMAQQLNGEPRPIEGGRLPNFETVNWDFLHCTLNFRYLAELTIQAFRQNRAKSNVTIFKN
jgi:hypothetical protein